MEKVITLINPPSSTFYPIYEERLGISYIAGACINAGYKVKVFECDMFPVSIEQIVDQVRSSHCKIAGIAITGDRDSEQMIVKITSKIKEAVPDCIIIAGGFHSTQYYQEVLKKMQDIDCIMIGESDFSFVQLCNDIIAKKNWMENDGIAYLNTNGVPTIKYPKKRISNLDHVPFPHREHFEYLLKKGTIPRFYSSRGCYGGCSFCNVNSFYKTQEPSPHWLARSPENIIEEIEALQKRGRFGYINFVDDNFMGGAKKTNKRAADFATLLIKKGMNLSWFFSCRAEDVEVELFQHLKNAGLTRLFVGIESMNQKMLQKMKKGNNVSSNKKAIEICQKLGIDLTCGFIMFTPWSTINDINDNLSFLESLTNVDIYTSVYLSSRKGSEIYSEIGKTSNAHDLGYTFMDNEVNIMFAYSQEKENLVNKYIETGREIWRYVEHSPEIEKRIKDLFFQMISLDISFMRKAYILTLKGFYVNSKQGRELLQATAISMLSLVQKICTLAPKALFHAKAFLPNGEDA